jgi:hypothetical protein
MVKRKPSPPLDDEALAGAAILGVIGLIVFAVLLNVFVPKEPKEDDFPWYLARPSSTQNQPAPDRADTAPGHEKGSKRPASNQFDMITRW